MSNYQPNIPTGLINLDVDYNNIRNNFSQLNTTFSKNHLPITDGSVNNGAHIFVEMRNSAGLPVGLTNLEGTIYSRIISATSQLFYTPDNSGHQYQMTVADGANFGTFGTNGTYASPPGFVLKGGWTFLPGGLIMQYGTITGTATDGTITYPKPFLSEVYSINLTFNRNGGSTTQSSRVNNFSAANLNNFEYSSTSSNNNPILWTAIGK